MSQEISPRYGRVILVSGQLSTDHDMDVLYQVSGPQTS